MSLQAFAYPLPETRFFHAGAQVFKFKIRYGGSVRGAEAAEQDVASRELQDSVRAVLGNLDNLQPFTTDHFIIFPYKSRWERVSHLRFKHGAALLEPYPFVCTLYVEMRGEPAGSPGGDNDPPDMGSDGNLQQEEAPDSHQKGTLAGSGLGEPRGHPPQLGSPPPPEGPPREKHAGFWAFVSSLFPFRLFGRRGSQ